MTENKKPYLVDYAKSNRSSCRGCQMQIQIKTLRIAHMVQSRGFDGMQTNWHHWSCFFGLFRPNNVSEIAKFRSLRVEDQDRIEEQMKAPSMKGAKGKGAKVSMAGSLQDFVVQYALSGRSTCRKCDVKIEKEEIRISKKGLDADKPYLGMVDRWYHVGCFLKRRKELDWKDGEYSIEMMTGWDAMDSKDKDTLKSIFDKKARGKKKKRNSSVGDVQLKREIPGETEEEKKREQALRDQNKKIWKIIDALTKANLVKGKLVMLLEANKQALPPGPDRLRERIADGLMFGRLVPCEICGGQLVPKETGYECCGDVSGWTACTSRPLTTKRVPWTIPAKLRAEYAFLEKHKYRKVERLFSPRPPATPLKDKKILLFGKFDTCTKDLKEKIVNLGGSLTSSMQKAYCCISTTEGMLANRNKVESAELADTFIVDLAFLDSCTEVDDEAITLLPLLKKHSIAPFGSEKRETSKELKRMLAEEENRNKKSKKQRLMVKDGVAVDPETELEEETEIVTISGSKYTVTLSLVNIQRGSNSYYKMQLLQSTKKKRWFLFRAWGRVGTTIGGKKTDPYGSLKAAKKEFDSHYLDKTGNEFGCANFVKQPNKFFPLDIEYGENNDQETIAEFSKAGADSKLHVSVQTLIKQIFDIESMKKTMLEFELDLNKMPLGKLSRQQMQNAYKILSDAIKLVDAGTLTGPQMHDVTNKFYTLIPHDFGFNQPTPLCDMDIINSKIRMLENLMEIEFAYNILDIKKEKDDEKEDILDTHYKKLHCDIKSLDVDTEEYKMVDKYASLTHATTHTSYKLKIENVFKINREGEEETFKPFQMLKNHKLLWHGSRTTNYAGILSQGLKIAPAEAPVTGYMFGKGVYFADMVSKSANYCAANNSNPYGYALLADVALGNMMELNRSKYVRKLPRGKHSVKGLGSNIPDPQDHIQFNGMEIPMGPQIEADLSKMKNKHTELLYNEYIVYDVSQINMKYLVKFKFDYQSSLW